MKRKDNAKIVISQKIFCNFLLVFFIFNFLY